MFYFPTLVFRLVCFVLFFIRFFSLSFAFFRQLFVAVPEDLSITRATGLTWEQWSAHLAMPLVTQLREGIHPLLFPTDLTVNPVQLLTIRNHIAFVRHQSVC